MQAPIDQAASEFVSPTTARRAYIRIAVFAAGLVLAMLLFVGAGSPGRPISAGSVTPTPVLLELFTSEGCSSCPPADALLAEIDARQPVPGAQLIVLSEHVDYWNHDGWTDPFSSASITDRQAAYVRTLGLKSAFTPQFLVDGTEQLQVRDSAQVIESLQQAASVPKVPMRFASLMVVQTGNSPTAEGRIESDVNSGKHKADVFVAVALDHAASQVSKGENSGRHLEHVAVVAEIAKIGKLEPGKSFAQDFRVKLKLPPSDSKGIRVVAFAQEPGPGKVLAVAVSKAATN